MSHLRKEFEKQTGLVADKCTGLGDYSGLQADSAIDGAYIKWLEAKVEKLALPHTPQLAFIGGYVAGSKKNPLPHTIAFSEWLARHSPRA